MYFFYPVFPYKDGIFITSKKKTLDYGTKLIPIQMWSSLFLSIVSIRTKGVMICIALGVSQEPEMQCISNILHDLPTKNWSSSNHLLFSKGHRHLFRCSTEDPEKTLPESPDKTQDAQVNVNF